MKDQIQTYLLVVVGVVIVGGLIWWGASQKDKPAGGEPIRIGAIFMLSGLASNQGQNSQQGADLAIKEINQVGGVNGRPIEIVYEDNQGDNPKQAVSAINKLIGEGIKIVLGTNWTPSGLALAPIACQQEVLMISPSLGVADFNERCDYLFNLWPHDDILSGRLGEFLYARGYRRIAILGSLQEWEKTQAEAVRKAFEQSGGTVVSYDLSQQGQSDFRTEATKIRSAHPEAVVLANYSFMHNGAKQLKEIGVTAPFFTMLIDEERIVGAQGALEETIVISSHTPTQEFVAKFGDAYGAQPDLGSDTSYDAVLLLVQAMKETGSVEPSVLKDYLNSLTTYMGASGDLEFDDKGGVTKSSVFSQVKNSVLVPYDPAN